MKIVIIEDEPLTAEDLAACIVSAEPAAEIVAMLASVAEANAWFGRNPAPDLVFSDIQLGDGRSFEIFERLRRMVPVIFCTAYDNYALEAFRSAGIDYLLKPFSAVSVGVALEKYRLLKRADPPKPGAGAILVHFKEKILPVKIGDIALFHLHNEVVRLMGFDGKSFLVNKSLEELELLAGAGFYRVNRQFLVNRLAIKDVSQYFGRKLLVNLV
jgi:DNA-binding LytR/AlgR family response regulator